MGFWDLVFVLFLSWIFYIPRTHQLQTYQTQVLLQLRKHLEYPPQLKGWENYNGDFCAMLLPSSVSITCQNNSVTELKITGDKFAKSSEFTGFSILDRTLSEGFSIDSFVTTLTRLTSLKVVSLVSLGIWGQLPDKIHRLYSLEVLDLSSNFLYGSIPPKISAIQKLQSLTLDGNFFNGTVPDWLNSLANLTILSLKNNQIVGHFPSSLCRIATLTDLALSQNKLSGKLPDLDDLNKLHLLDLRENHFDSQLPRMPKGLVTALLSENSFSGNIPEKFGELTQLRHFDLSYNSLSGTPPSALFSLPKISYLNLASNMLRGSLSSQLRCGDELGFVDISTNRLTGKLPPCLDTSSDKRVVKFSGNCLSVDSLHQHHESYCKEQHMLRRRSRGKERGLIAGVIGGIAILTIVLAFGFVILLRKYHARASMEEHKLPDTVQDNLQTGHSAELLANARLISQAAKAGIEGASSYRLFSLGEIEQATSNFSTLLGEGFMGKVFRGRLADGTDVAIRFVSLFRKYPIQSLKLRLDLLAKLRHPHLVGLLGHCIDGGGQEQFHASRVFLVYEFMPNGSFRTHLAENCLQKALKWSDRLAILIDVAKAVHFLHTGVIPGSFSNRLTTSNILLDEHLIAKLSDYGMSILTEELEKIEGKGESSKAWQKGKLEDDVYNFGFILLEALVGPIAGGKGEAFLLHEMVSFGNQDGQRKIVDPIVLATSSQESLSIVISITSKCISPEAFTHPSFEDVLWNLQYAAQVQASSDADRKSDATSLSS
ncbi:hypothetical protein Nepgr_016868 [Nepenthes gracilis]|uniref:Protein kinase domain-containing protein n=1 Tax=Nepenthes gracilis TaxID=150966 RepID=A0AAD3XRP1_NEPGR|nr:hypothetical protein Nepgr_016868 [Nepenthes gracilis]